jgi:uncharacterized repeat protein (TIGR03803 family)
MPAPTITGTVSSQATTSETPIHPFSGVTIGDANAGATDTLSITLSGPGSLSGTGLSLSSGNYTLTGTAAAITSELRALSFTPVDGVPNTSVTTTFKLSDTSSAYGVHTYDGQLSTLATFTGANGAKPLSNLVSDAAGDLFGVTSGGGAGNDGTVFEIAKSTGALTTIASFTSANGADPLGVTSDAAGDLFGTIYVGANNDGTVFEIAKSTGELTTLATFTGANGANPLGTVISDAAGDLFGTTGYGGANGYGTVFEIAKSTGKLTTLATFTGANGATPAGSLTIDAEGDLFGTTANGGAGGAAGDGTVFEIAKSTGELTTLATFTGANGEHPERGLTIDAAGDLFGTTFRGGADNDGTVFEIVKSTGALITLATFTGANGASPLSQLVSDAAGDLFGTTETGGADNGGTAFEIAKSTGSLSTLATFTGANGDELNGGLTINSAGDLFGTTYYGGANDDGTAFELPATFVATPAVDNTTTVTVTDSDPVSDILWQDTSTGQASIWGMAGNTRTGGGAVSPNPGPSWKVVGTGAFFSGDTSDILWQNTSTGQASIWEMNGTTRTGGGAVSPNPGPSWTAVGTGDFNGDGNSDILWQSTNGQASIWEMDGNTRIGGGPAGSNPGPSWKAVGTGDFNHDGLSDILWQNKSTGQVSIWEMDGNTRIGGGAVSLDPGPTWKAVGTGDFYGNGDSDILFQNTSTGQASIWEMDGNTRIGGGAVTPIPGPSWHAIGTDGGSDILFQNMSGQVSVWEMDGSTRIGSGAVSPNPGPTWRAVGLT